MSMQSKKNLLTEKILPYNEKKRIRANFGKVPLHFDIPNLLEIQLRSYREFIGFNSPKDSGLAATFKSIFPIKSFSSDASLEYVGHRFEKPVFNERECKQRGLTYGVS